MAVVDFVTASGNRLTDSLLGGTRWANEPGSLSTKTVITVGYYVNASQKYQAPSDAELTAMKSLESLFEKYLNIDIQWVGQDQSQSADINFGISTDPAETALGWAWLPGGDPYNPGHSFVSIMRHNYAAEADATLTPGSFDYITFVHEFAHALGLTHPHDTDNLYGQAFPQVTSEFDDLGAYNLNQGVFTTMTYNDGWRTGPSPSGYGSGYQAGPMALDIQALQYLYGANAGRASGGNTYLLPGANGAGVGYLCIWDTGGADVIGVTPGLAKACVVDLRPATGLVQAGGGGFISHVLGVTGGFTIAKGVTIEQAHGGAGNDVLIGNQANNLLLGRGGRDVMYGHGGNDIFRFDTTAQSSAIAANADVIKDFNVDGDHINLQFIDARPIAGDQAFIFKGTAAFTAAGQVRYAHAGADTLVYLNTDSDLFAESIIRLTGLKVLGAEDFML